MKPTKGQRIFAVFNYILLTLLALLCLLPMLNIVALSFSSRNMVNAGAVTSFRRSLRSVPIFICFKRVD